MVVFEYSTVTSNAIPVFYNTSESFLTFTRLFVRREKLQIFGPKDLMLLLPK